jgi:hypothetical protein
MQMHEEFCSDQLNPLPKTDIRFQHNLEQCRCQFAMHIECRRITWVADEALGPWQSHLTTKTAALECAAILPPLDGQT